MSGFSYGGGGCATSIIPPAPGAADAVVANDGWLPDVDAAAMRTLIRTRDSVTPERLREAILGAMITVGNDVAAWQRLQRDAGHASLAAVPAARLGGESRLVILYRRAVACLAKADLVESARDVDTTAAGDRKLDALDPTIDELRRDGRHAIRDLLGATRTTVALI